MVLNKSLKRTSVPIYISFLQRLFTRQRVFVSNTKADTLHQRSFFAPTASSGNLILRSSPGHDKAKAEHQHHLLNEVLTVTVPRMYFLHMGV